jgi:hypothetical protein
MLETATLGLPGVEGGGGVGVCGVGVCGFGVGGVGVGTGVVGRIGGVCGVGTVDGSGRAGVGSGVPAGVGWAATVWVPGGIGLAVSCSAAGIGWGRRSRYVGTATPHITRITRAIVMIARVRVPQPSARSSPRAAGSSCSGVGVTDQYVEGMSTEVGRHQWCGPLIPGNESYGPGVRACGPTGDRRVGRVAVVRVPTEGQALQVQSPRVPGRL